jgi:PAS domain S-box-containing protein
MYWSDEMFNIFGRDPQKPVPPINETYQLFTPESWKRVESAMENSLQTGKTYEVDAEILRPDGSKRWIIQRGDGERDEHGNTIRLWGTCQDITDRKQAEEDIIRLNKAVEASGEVMFMTDRQGIFTYVNKSFTRLYGYQPEEVMGKTTPRILKSGVQNSEAYDVFWHALLEKKIFKGELINRTKDGRQLHIESTSNSILGTDGSIIGFLAVQRDITERKHTEQLIADALAFNRALFESSSIGIITFNDAGDVTSVNSAVPKMIGGTREQLQQQNFHQLQSWKDSGVNEAATRVLRTGVGELIETSMVTTFGKNTWLSCRFEPFNHDRKRHLVMSITDISDRKRSEQRLKMQYNISRVLSESATVEAACPIILKSVLDAFGWDIGEFWLVDPAVNALRCAEFLAAEGFDGSEFEQAARQMIFPPGIGLCGEIWAERKPKWDRDFSKASNRPRNAMARKAGFQGAIGFPIMSGSQFIGVIMFGSSKIVDPDTDILQMFSTIGMQIGEFMEHKRADDNVKRNEEKYRTLFEESKDTIFIASPDGSILAVNPAGLDLLGYQSTEEIADFKIGKDLYWDPAERQSYLEILRLHGSVQDYELELKTRDGKKVVVLVNARAVYDDHNNVTLIRGTLRNVTAEKQLEQQFIQVQKLEGIGTLAGGIAHDFNNILGIIMGYLGLLETGTPSPELLKNSLEVMNTAVNRGTNLVKQILTFARQGDIVRGPLDVNIMTKEFIKMIKETFPKTIAIEFNLDTNLPLIMADPTQFHQILLNICVNARDAMPKGGRIMLTTGRVSGSSLRAIVQGNLSDAYLHLSISDTGVGMTPEIRAHVFEPFFTTKEKGKGTGLGLATVYGIVKHHNGHIIIESEPGKGSSVHLYFPLPAKMDEVSYPSKMQPENIRGNNETVFLIEDEELLLNLVKSLLEGHGYRVITAMNGEEAIHVYREHIGTIDLVLTDMDIPKLSGEQIYSVFRELNPAVKLIFASGFIEPEIKAEMFRRGARSFLEKPYRPMEILKSVREALDHKA